MCGKLIRSGESYHDPSGSLKVFLPDLKLSVEQPNLSKCELKQKHKIITITISLYILV